MKHNDDNIDCCSTFRLYEDYDKHMTYRHGHSEERQTLRQISTTTNCAYRQ
ncbi:hypothetical protein T4E_9847 [Trichinella pseudospiralis]|uniref:Uncharacterized protein n=1 Tax=Trichinella pseudospiralis TaxID=6337 RepID=A0A0V0X172_TRIPS|nr:hypothetical protein T4E_9847 [Trichinella pseudospiralis]